MKAATKKEVNEKALAVAEKEAQRLNALLGFGALFNAQPETLTPAEAVIAWSLLDLFGDLSTARLADLRLLLLDLAVKNGNKEEKGHFRAEFEGTTVINQLGKAHDPSEKHIKELLKARGQDPNQVYSKVETYKFDLSKVENLIMRGILTQDEVDEGKKETHSLRVTPSAELKGALEGVRRQIEKIKPPKELKGKKSSK